MHLSFSLLHLAFAMASLARLDSAMADGFLSAQAGWQEAG